MLHHAFLLSVLLLPGLLSAQINWKGLKDVEITYGAENDKLPPIGDTIIRSFFYQSEAPRELIFRDSAQVTILGLDQEGRIVKRTEHPLSDLKNSLVTKYHENGNVVLKASYAKGLVDGDFRKFHDNGQPMEVGTYDRIKKVGVWEYYDEEGLLARKEWWEKGKLLRTE